MKMVGGCTGFFRLTKSRLVNQTFRIPFDESYKDHRYRHIAGLTVLLLICVREHVIFDFREMQLLKKLQNGRYEVIVTVF
jgi:hypothetical protein